MLKTTHPNAAATGTRRRRPRLSSCGDSAICFAAKANGEEARGDKIVVATAKFLAKDNEFSGLLEGFWETGTEVGFEDDDRMMKWYLGI